MPLLAVLCMHCGRCARQSAQASCTHHKLVLGCGLLQEGAPALDVAEAHQHPLLLAQPARHDGHIAFCGVERDCWLNRKSSPEDQPQLLVASSLGRGKHDRSAVPAPGALQTCVLLQAPPHKLISPTHPPARPPEAEVVALHALLVLPSDCGTAHLQQVGGVRVANKQFFSAGKPARPTQHRHELQAHWVTQRHTQQQPGIPPTTSATSCLAQVGVALPPRRQAGAQLAGAAAAHLQRKHDQGMRVNSAFTWRTAQMQQICVACAHSMTPDSKHRKQAAWHPQDTHRLAHAAGEAVAALGWVAAAELHRAGIGAWRKDGETGVTQNMSPVQPLAQHLVQQLPGLEGTSGNTPAHQNHASQQAVKHALQPGRHGCPAATHLFAEVGVSGAGAVGTAHASAAAWEVLGPHLQAGAESFLMLSCCAASSALLTDCLADLASL